MLDLPEDLCFFINDRLLLGTVSHEYLCYAYPPTDEIEKKFMKLGNWVKVDYCESEHIQLEPVGFKKL